MGGFFFYVTIVESLLRIDMQIKVNQVMEVKYFRWRVGSDVYPFEVIKKCTESKYLVREMDFSIVDEEGECGNYRSVETNPIITIRRHKNGRFYEPNSRCCPFLPSREPVAYRDFGF